MDIIMIGLEISVGSGGVAVLAAVRGLGWLGVWGEVGAIWRWMLPMELAMFWGWELVELGS